MIARAKTGRMATGTIGQTGRSQTLAGNDRVKRSLGSGKTVLSDMSELLLPQICNLCGCEDAHAICDVCFDLHFIPLSTVCNRCGRERISGVPGDDCALCHDTDMRFRQARSLFSYGDTARRVFLEAKFSDRRYALARSLASKTVDAWLSGSASHLKFVNNGFDFVIDVPIIRPMGFRERLAGLFSFRMPQKVVNRRNFNFSQVLAQTMAERLNVKWRYDVLEKIRDVPSQIGLGESERRRNVLGAFDVGKRYRDLLKGCRILLVDDLMTTGATASECAKTLRRSGAREVFVFTMFSTSPIYKPERSSLDDARLHDDLYIPDPIL